VARGLISTRGSIRGIAFPNLMRCVLSSSTLVPCHPISSRTQVHIRWAHRRTGGLWYLGPDIAGLSNNWMRRRANAFETSVLNLSVRLGCNRSKQTSFMPRQRSLNRSGATVYDSDLIGEGSPSPTQDDLPHHTAAVLHHSKICISQRTNLSHL